MARTLILMYHILDQSRSQREARFCCTPKRFSQQMQYLSTSGYELLSLDQIEEITQGRRQQERPGVAVTFDDGFADFHQNALPILEQWKIPATLFMVSQRIGQSNDWMRNRGFPSRPLLSLEQLREARDAGVTIGSHTCTHARLNEISSNPEQLQEQLEGSKKELEQILGQEVKHFAYPFGLHDPATIAAVKQAGYNTACSTRSGFNRQDIDPLELRRIEVYGRDNMWHFRQKLKFGVNDMPYTFPLKYYATQLMKKIS
ncbi:MAG: polysaccharide deacetylase family protein [Candidatus Reddybacter sp.]